MLNGLDLFSGYGGISIALKDYVHPIAYCEIERYCQAILLDRMGDGTIHRAPIWDDIRTFDPSQFPKHSIDIIYGGFPCQDISVAGNGKGLEGERSRLFFEIVRLAKEILPTFIFLENVPAITSRGGLRVIREVAEIGYDCRYDIFSAQEVGAPHKRERWFLLARHSMRKGIDHGTEQKVFNAWKSANCSRTFIDDANPQHLRLHGTEIVGSSEESVRVTQKGTNCTEQSAGMDSADALATKFASNSTSSREDGSSRGQKGFSSNSAFSLQSYWQKVESPLCGVDDGPPYRAHRIRACGNGVVPQQVKKAFKTLMGLSEQ